MIWACRLVSRSMNILSRALKSMPDCAAGAGLGWALASVILVTTSNTFQHGDLPRWDCSIPAPE